MIKQILRLSLFLIILFLTNINLRASHYAGHDLTYLCLGGNSYLISYSFYRDCSGIVAPTTVTVAFNCSSNPSFNFTSILQKIPNTGHEITSTCGETPSTCNNGNTYGVQEHIYQATVTLNPCNSWEISTSSCCRNPVTTVHSNATNAYFAYAKLNNLNAFCNSSPDFSTFNPEIIVCNGQEINLSFGGIDPDGDSLVYSLIPSKTSISASVLYAVPWSSTYFLTSNGIQFNTNTGELSFKPTQNLSTLFCIKVEEYRIINGSAILIGEVYRDLPMMVTACNNNLPKLSGIDLSLSHTYNPADTIYNYNACVDGTPITFDINGFDADTFNPSGLSGANHLFNIDWDNRIPNANFTVYNNGSDSAYANFNWLPDSTNYGKTYFFKAIVKDSACPYNGVQSYTYSLTINPKPDAFSLGNDTIIDVNQVLFLSMPNGYSNYQWSTGDTTQVTLITNLLGHSNPIIGTAFNNNKCLVSDSIEVSFSTTGINQADPNQIKVYPNPVKNSLNIVLAKEYQETNVEVFDMNGKLLFSDIFSGGSFEISNFQTFLKGVYILRLYNSEFTINKQIVKE